MQITWIAAVLLLALVPLAAWKRLRARRRIARGLRVYMGAAQAAAPTRDTTIRAYA